MASVKIERKTKETDIHLELNLDGTGTTEISTGIGFFDHMLNAFAFYACFDLKLECKGDLHVCGHHSVEDVGIVLGQAIHQGLAQNKNIVRFASVFAPMDESLSRAVIDISGRAHLVFRGNFQRTRVGEFDTELAHEFFQALVNNAKVTLHLHVLHGENTHHQIESLFKATGMALRQALQTDPKRSAPTSTKGAL